ncbi:MAG: hypothetical protein ABJM29_13725 [Rhizobiaceae bacterium]
MEEENNLIVGIPLERGAIFCSLSANGIIFEVKWSRWRKIYSAVNGAGGDLSEKVAGALCTPEYLPHMPD